ncbi:MAG: transglycosylase domain-containing protein [Bacteroidota bacterium]
MQKIFKWLFKAVIMLLAILFLLSGLFFLSVSSGVFGSLPTKTELAEIYNEEASLVFSSGGTLIGKYFAENRTNISWDGVPEHLINALIATEDKRFYLHGGYDSRSYLRVFVKTILLGDRSSGGGSTLTQQLVKNLYGRNYHSFLSMPINKLKEAIIATRLEEVFSKEEILLLYLNSVPFGENVYGIEAASKRYFDKHAIDLNIQESAVMVGILKANTYYNPRKNPENAIGRRNQILGLMTDENFLTPGESDSLKALPLELKYANYQKDSPAGYFVYQVKKRASQILENIQSETGVEYDLSKDGLRIYTSLDIDIQKFARKATNRQLKKMQKLLDNQLKRKDKRKQWQKKLSQKYDTENIDEKQKREIFDWDGLITKEITFSDSLWHYYKMLNAAVLIAEPTSGRVLGWIGGNKYRYLPYDMVFSKRQIASAIKPLIYAAALESGKTSCSYLKNEVVEYENYNNWRPENYDHSSSKDTLVALWYALANSMNLPTVDLYFQTGHFAVADMLRRLNLEVPSTETPSMALGAIDVSLYEIVLAYSAIANRGVIHDGLVMIDKITDTKGNIIYKSDIDEGTIVMETQIADELTVILEKAINEGTGKQIRMRFGVKADLAGKTGTAQSYTDAWFMAYTPNLVIGTWVGARSPQIHFSNGLGSGSALALPISGEILLNIEKQNNLKAKYLTNFKIDPQIVEMLDCEPFFEKGLSGFINRIKGDPTDNKIEIEDEVIKPESEKKKKKSGFRRFIDKIFKGKDK